MVDSEYLDKFEKGLEDDLVLVCRSLGMLSTGMLASDDIDGKWKEFAPEYMTECARNVNDYPEYSIACAAYAGMAIAHWWDEDWGPHHGCAFSDLQGPGGFDDMDDHITVSVLQFSMESGEAGVIRTAVEALSTRAWDYIRHSGIERGTADAFHALARVCRVMYRVGAAMELKRLGYSYQAVNLGSGLPLS